MPGFARPLGMKFGNEAEEPLWREWNRWLIENRFLPSAQRGGGAATYINYPISQSLLRRTDKDRLRKLFQEKQWQAEWDAQTLFAHVRREAGGFGIHLKDLLTENKQRHEAIVEALHQVYEQWKAQGCPTADKNNYCTWSRHLFCGLYRTEYPFLGQVDYSLLPKIGAWLVNHGPQITIFGFYHNAELKVTRLSDNQTILESSQSTNTSIMLDFAHPGDYLIEATFAGESSQL